MSSLRHWLPVIGVNAPIASFIAILILAAILSSKSAWYLGIRERAFDAILSFDASIFRAEAPVIIDIGWESIETTGPYPWPRGRLAATAKGLGLLVILGDSDGVVRRIPALGGRGFIAHARPGTRIDPGCEGGFVCLCRRRQH